MEDYNPADMTLDAVHFSRSKYGKHYLLSLQKSVEYHKDMAIDTKLSLQDNRDHAVRADQDRINIQYFETAASIASKPSLLQKLRESYNKRIKKGDNTKV